MEQLMLVGAFSSWLIEKYTVAHCRSTLNINVCLKHLTIALTAATHGCVCVAVGPGDEAGVEAVVVIEGLAAMDPTRIQRNGSRRDILIRNRLTFVSNKKVR